MQNFLSYFRFKKTSRILTHAYHLFKRKQKKLSEAQKNQLEKQLKALQEAILKKDLPLSKKLSQNVKTLTEDLFPKTHFEKAIHFVLALAVALSFALLIRQTLFEFYEIPTGSMRPTLKEKDRLVVSKTSFGINIPFSLKHVTFSPDLVQRNGIVVFSGENMDIRDVDTRYFYLFPGKKQYVKRLMGKPGDTLYFYGGLIYGIDKNGKDISKELQPLSLNRIEHIPFIHFEGKVVTPSEPINGIYSPVTLYQMNEPVAKLFVTGSNQVKGETLPIHSTKTLPNYDDLWGIKNFGMGRLLTKQQVLQCTNNSLQDIPEGILYLEIEHHPNFQNIKIRKDGRGRVRPMLGLNSSIIPLNEEHIKTLFSNLYTARFIVKNGLAYRYGLPKTTLQSPFLPKLPGVPDGTYEFYYGKAHKISFEGVSFELPKDHPLYHLDPQRMQLFYNLGIEFDTRILPQGKYSPYFPSRYVYFKNGDLYVMGAPLFLASDPILTHFCQMELAKEASSPEPHHYSPFVDAGPPLLSDGSLDVSLIQKYGLSIPEKMYLVLGDNHAMSADSRDFGFAPEDNLKGAPDFIFWPPGSRFGHPNQPSYPFMNVPRSIMWTLTGICIVIGVGIQKRRNKLPLDFS